LEIVTPMTTLSSLAVTIVWDLGAALAAALGLASSVGLGARVLGLDLGGRLVLAQALERRLADRCRRR
jgi:hypothetical protein